MLINWGSPDSSSCTIVQTAYVGRWRLGWSKSGTGDCALTLGVVLEEVLSDFRPVSSRPGRTSDRLEVAVGVCNRF